jgi:S1-C subfamily serine protease
MVLTPTGEVLTNNHVVEGATSISVTIPGRSGDFTATVLGADPTGDVALLQIEDVSGLPTVTLADSSTVRVGEGVVAIGNALGQGGTPTVTSGTVTATNRDITVGGDGTASEHLNGLIQTDASISPGDSGGPLVNASGQVIGMITASARSQFGQESSVGFAIPSNNALDVVRQVRSGDSSSSVIIGEPGYLGVEVRDLDSQSASQLGLGITSGALVVGVVTGMPADGVGIRQNAVITEVDGKPIGSADDLGPALHQHKPGESVRVTWVDSSGTHSATVNLVSGPAI